MSKATSKRINHAQSRRRVRRAENAYTDEVMAPEAELRESLFQEMRGRIKEDDSTVPEKEGEYFYYARYEEGNEYPIFCRKHLSLDAPEAIRKQLGDLVGEYTPSPSGASPESSTDGPPKPSTPAADLPNAAGDPAFGV